MSQALTAVSDKLMDVRGSFPLPTAVLQHLPHGTRIIRAEKSGVSAWTRTAKISAILPNGVSKEYFFKSIKGPSARAVVEGEYDSASRINTAKPGFSPEPAGWGTYVENDSQYYYYVGSFHDMDLATAPDPAEFSSRVAELHQNGDSPTGMFGYPVTTVIGKLERTVKWEKSWADSFTNQMWDVINYDNDLNGTWPELSLACKQLIDAVIPRLLGALQSDGRSIKPCLIHGDLWENNVGIDMETGDIIVFDPGSTYAHNEMEFGTWRCSWANHFKLPAYMRSYQRFLEPSEPVEEWDDRNRLYSIHAYLVHSGGHVGVISRQIAFNDILYLCEKYAPLESLQKYDPTKDVVLTGGYVTWVIKQGEE